MEIERVHIHQVDIPLHEPFVTALKPIPELERVIVEVETDTGVVGVGEGAPAYEVTGETQRSTAAVIEDVLAPVIIGADPMAIERVREQMWALVDGAPSAHAALEIALQDIRGKVADLPLYVLLGGAAEVPELRVPKVLSIKSPEEMAADAAAAVAEGYDQIKIKVGGDPDTDADRVAAIVDAVPESVHLKADANQGWGDAKTALYAIEQIAAHIDVIEQPVRKTDVRALQLLRDRVDIPVMPDESAEDDTDVAELIRLDAGDMYNIKLMKTGGISEAIRLDAVAAASGCHTQIGSMVEGHIGTAAGVHFALARENVIWNEMVGPFMATTGITDLQVDLPTITATGPGLGVNIDRDALTALRSDHVIVEAE